MPQYFKETLWCTSKREKLVCPYFFVRRGEDQDFMVFLYTHIYTDYTCMPVNIAHPTHRSTYEHTFIMYVYLLCQRVRRILFTKTTFSLFNVDAFV